MDVSHVEAKLGIFCVKPRYRFTCPARAVGLPRGVSLVVDRHVCVCVCACVCFSFLVLSAIMNYTVAQLLPSLHSVVNKRVPHCMRIHCWALGSLGYYLLLSHTVTTKKKIPVGRKRFVLTFKGSVYWFLVSILMAGIVARNLLN